MPLDLGQGAERALHSRPVAEIAIGPSDARDKAALRREIGIEVAAKKSVGPDDQISCCCSRAHRYTIQVWG